MSQFVDMQIIVGNQKQNMQTELKCGYTRKV